jgi:hypothetical protein
MSICWPDGQSDDERELFMNAKKVASAAAQKPKTLRTPWLYVGPYSYVLDLHETDLPTVVADIEDAIENKRLLKVMVLDEKDRVMTLYLNGSLIDTCVIDEDRGARPHEPM